MQIVIDTDKLSKRDLSVNEYLTLLSIYHKGKNNPINYIDRKVDYFSLQEKQYLLIDGSSVALTIKSIRLIEGVGRDYTILAISIRDQFPKGSKGGKYPWKGTVKAIADKLKKLDKSFGLSEYSDQQIIDSVRNYVNRFTLADMDRGMQIATYFIEKDGDSSLMAWLNMEPEQQQTKSMEIRL